LDMFKKWFKKLQLIKALRDKNETVRSKAAEALGYLGDMKAFEPLIEALQDKNETVRSKAAEALGYLGDMRAFEPLIEALKDKNDTVRSAAAVALGHLGDKRAFEPLIKALQDKDDHVRPSAAYALGHLGDKRAFEPLIKALHDEVEDVRYLAEFALGNLGDKRAVKYLSEGFMYGNTLEKLYASGGLYRLGEEKYAKNIISAIEDSDWAVRRTAVYILQTCDIRQACGALSSRLEIERNEIVIESINSALNILRKCNTN
jgi:HEAT repeat protein